ncbi:hypothetical protein pb186bvf_020432 [Paramecium bursaria]
MTCLIIHCSWQEYKWLDTTMYCTAIWCDLFGSSYTLCNGNEINGKTCLLRLVLLIDQATCNNSNNACQYVNGSCQSIFCGSFNTESTCGQISRCYWSTQDSVCRKLCVQNIRVEQCDSLQYECHWNPYTSTCKQGAEQVPDLSVKIQVQDIGSQIICILIIYSNNSCSAYFEIFFVLFRQNFLLLLQEMMLLDLNMIATGSVDLSIKLWHAEQGFQILEKQNSHGGKINQVLFIKKQKQIISSDQCGTLKIWKINYEREDLEELKQIREEDGIYNMSLMKNCQFFIIISKEYVKLYSIQGEYIDQFCNYLQISSFQQTIQLESMEGIIIFDKSNYQVYKIGKVKLYKEIKQK